jgi:hypothetical protein
MQYSNVVAYYNTCAIANLTKGDKDTVYVKVNKANQNLYDSKCVKCQVISETPPLTKINIAKIRETPCSKNPKRSMWRLKW